MKHRVASDCYWLAKFSQGGSGGTCTYPPIPSTTQRTLGVFLLGISVARYQMLVERRTTLQDLPISGMAVLGLSAIYAWLAWRWGMQPEMISAVTMLAILTHSIYDLGREHLERQRFRNESAFRRQLRQFESEVSNEVSMQRCLQEGLDLLCHTLRASGGFMAVRRGEDFVVTATHYTGRTWEPTSIPLLLALALILTNDLHHLMYLGFFMEGSIRPLHGISYWVFLVYAYSLDLANIILFIWLFIRSPHHRWPVVVMVSGQVLGRVLYLLDAA